MGGGAGSSDHSLSHPDEVAVEGANGQHQAAQYDLWGWFWISYWIRYNWNLATSLGIDYLVKQEKRWVFFDSTVARDRWKFVDGWIRIVWNAKRGVVWRKYAHYYWIPISCTVAQSGIELLRVQWANTWWKNCLILFLSVMPISLNRFWRVYKYCVKHKMWLIQIAWSWTLERSKENPLWLWYSIQLNGGYDKMSLHVTALNGFELKSWSFTPLDIQDVNKRYEYWWFMITERL